MDENIKKTIKEKFDSLPESIQELIMSSHYQDILVEIGKKYQLNVEQMGILERETTLVMMGLSPTQSFESELTQELNIDKMKGNQIVIEINEKIFLTIRDLLKLMYTPAGEEPSVEEVSKSKEQPTESREELLKHIENLDLLTQKELPVGNPEELKEQSNKENILKNTPEENHPILAQKLSGSFQIPAVETEHSLANMTKSSGEEKTKPKVDPYRMPIE